MEKKKVLKKFCVSYRNEFSVEITAKNVEDAIKIAEKQSKWEQLGDLWQGYLEAKEVK